MPIDLGPNDKFFPNFLTLINSPAPATLECEDIICYTRLVPDLGIPRIKIGVGLIELSFIFNEFIEK